MSHKLGICIPYRRREQHLKQLVPHLSKHLTDRGIEHKFYVAHQIDDNLFNRGAMKNIAAKHAFEDGCDYVAWHDVDMLPYNSDGEIGPDYSYPEEYPLHIATKLSKYGYGLGYDQYFGGVVLFTKEHIEKTNGYSNGYWDWGMEDDDLFWRCYFEGLTTGRVFRKYENKKVAVFNGNTSNIVIPPIRKYVECLNKNHTLSILVNTEQQPDKTPIWLIGDQKREFIEYPIFTKSGGFNYRVSFNNSRTYTVKLYDEFRNQIYNWIKRFENMWTWVTLSVDVEKKELYFYLNNELTRNYNGNTERLPYPYEGTLLRYDLRSPFFLGFDNQTSTHFKGKIAEVRLYNQYYGPDEINDLIDNKIGEPVMYENFDNQNIDGTIPNDVYVVSEDVEVIENVIPYRREGKFYCLPHFDEGFVNGRWVKGETTARNEKRFVTEMQQRKIDYKNDGLSTLKYDLINIELFMDNCLMINVKL
jgi:hypothetical protein